MSSHLQSLGFISLRGVIANLHPSFARARLARGTLNVLGLHDVPVGIGTDGGDTSGTHSSEQFESTASLYIIKEEDEVAMKGLEIGQLLLQRLYEATPDVDGIEGGLTIVITSSLKDISNFVGKNPALFA